MDTDYISNIIKIYGIKEIILNNGKRLCYLVSCKNCYTLHYKARCELLKSIKRNKNLFCSRKCKGLYHSVTLNVSCANCNKSFVKLPSQIKQTKNNFCSKSCAATFNNKHKNYGNRRSKIEKLIENMLRTKYPNIIFTCNNKDAIKSELDFYFPYFKLAIQINGPLHYKPIYGQLKLDKIQKMDQEKRMACEALKIKLIEINCSEDSYLNKNIIDFRLKEIENILAEARVFETHTS